MNFINIPNGFLALQEKNIRERFITTLFFYVQC